MSSFGERDRATQAQKDEECQRRQHESYGVECQWVELSQSDLDHGEVDTPDHTQHDECQIRP